MKRTQEAAGYQLLPFPAMRRLVIDGLAVALKKHFIHGFLEADVTRARKLLREHKERSGESLSFTAFVAACTGKAIAENPLCHAYRRPLNKLVVFDDVDLAILVEHQFEQGKLATFHVVKAVQAKTAREVHHEVRAAQREDVERQPHSQLAHLFVRLPGFLRRLILSILHRLPSLWKQYAGTACITAVGMFGRGTGWALPIAQHTLCVTLGGVGEKPGVVDGRIEARELLSITVSVDHDIVDGALAARFSARLRELIENGYGLDGLGRDAHPPQSTGAP